MKNESKEQRFIRVAEKRVQNTLKAISSLSQCANPKVYVWDDQQLKIIWAAIDNELAICKQQFSDPNSRIFKL